MVEHSGSFTRPRSQWCPTSGQIVGPDGGPGDVVARPIGEDT
jgi:hypothetical protein